MNEVWLICFSVAAPVAAVVGFGVQIRRLRNLKLENDKLALEVSKLRSELYERERRIVLATPDEIDKYEGPKFSRLGPRPSPVEIAASVASLLLAGIGVLLLLIVLAIVISYAAYDIFRFLIWLVG